MTRLSVNINKIATLRNARGGNIPNLIEAALNCERFGAQGITVHPRPDERHVRYRDVYELKEVVTTEFNIEGYPSEKFLELVKIVKPDQVTLVPDKHDAITSDQGWNTIDNKDLLKKICSELKTIGIRVSIFIDPNLAMVEAMQYINADRIELYTEPYATNYSIDSEHAIENYIKSADMAKQIGLGVNAGHDLSLENLNYLIQQIPSIDEVSIGHALIADALYYGLENTIQMYLRQLK